MSDSSKQPAPTACVGAALFVSADRENTEPVPGRVQNGSVPEWLNGCLIRNGPGLFEVGETRYNHYFDGLALLRKFSISNGRVEFSSQFLRSDAYTTNMAYKRIVISEFGTRTYPDPCKSLFGRFASVFYTSDEEAKLRAQRTDNTVVNVFPIGDHVYAATETPFMNRINPMTLERLGKVDLSQAVSVNATTAHPHFEPDGSVLNLGSDFRDRTGPKYLVVRIPPNGVEQATVVAKIPSRYRLYPAYYHSFAVTKNYIVFVESPLTLSIPMLIAANALDLTYDGCMSWKKGEGALLHVVSRADGRNIQAFKAADFFTFHHMNAFEDEATGEIVVDLSAYGSGDVMKRLSLKKMQTLRELPKNDLTLRRYRMKLGGESVATYTEPARRLALEFPQINYRYNGLPYRYGYGVGSWMPASSPEPSVRPNSGIIKLDWQTEEVRQWHVPDCEPSEAVFVEHPEPETEDHGLLLSSVIRLTGQRSLFMIILDARTMAVAAKVDFDGVSIPSGFHGMFFSEEQLVRAAAAATEKEVVAKDE